MLRVVTSCGTAQLLYLCSSLKSQAMLKETEPNCDILLLSGSNLLENRKEAMLSLAKAAWEWQDIIMIDQYLRPASKEEGISPEKVAQKIAPYGKPDEIWFCMPHEVEEKTLMFLYPDAKLHLCEDGLGTYIDLFTYSELLRHPKRCIKHMRSMVLRNSGLLRKVFSNTASYYPSRALASSHLFLSPKIPIPHHLRSMPCSLVSSEAMLDIIMNIRKKLAFSTPNTGVNNKNKRVLFMGQYFSDNDPENWKKEYSIYRQGVEYYQEKDFEVWWKEHPKARRPFGDQIEKELTNVKMFDSNNYYPIELFIEKGMFNESVSVSSTSLFTLEKLYQITPKTLINMINFPIPGTFNYVRDLMGKKVEQFKCIKESNR